jgi:hypothetical protein
MSSSEVTCRCGKVGFAAAGAPIVTATCHCQSCQTAGAAFAALPGAPRVLNAEGGTEFALFRKDRVVCLRGEALLGAHRLAPQASTRRVLARCCDTPMFLEFAKGHWLSIYRDRLGTNAPPIDMRVMTRERRAGVVLSAGVPSYQTHSFGFMWRLLSAWVAMGFRAPALHAMEEV